jgi:hypothetical protein
MPAHLKVVSRASRIPT